MSCRKAMGAAEEMKKLFGEKLVLRIHTTDSEEAKKYNFRSSANVVLDGELIPLDVSTDRNRMKDFLSERIAEGKK